LYTFGRVCSEPCSVAVIEGIDGFDQSHRSDGDQIILTGLCGVVFPNDMRHQTEIVLNQAGPRLFIPFCAEFPKQFLFFGSGNGRRKILSGRNAQHQIGKSADQIHDPFTQHSMIPLFSFYSTLYARPVCPVRNSAEISSSASK
jgi:hypothetical protein